MNLPDACRLAVDALRAHPAQDTNDAIDLLTALADAGPPYPLRAGALRELAVDLDELHDQEAISLDTWVAGREFVEAFLGPITENRV